MFLLFMILPQGLPCPQLLFRSRALFGEEPGDREVPGERNINQEDLP